jgi:predicted RNA binding protein YcfA (HicA-like mRNA interferase family)
LPTQSWVISRRSDGPRASGCIFRKDARTVVVPQHQPLKPGTLKGIVEQAGLTVQEFIDHL